MVRFGTKTLLFAFVLVALWCSTFSGYAAGRDVRASVLLILFMTVGYAAVYSRGRPRAFWSGFLVVMLVAGGNVFEGPINKYVPNFLWRTNPSSPSMQSGYYAPVVVYPSPVAPQPAQPSDPTPALPDSLPVAPQVSYAPVAVNDYQFRLAMDDTISALWTLVLASLVGLVGIWVYGSVGRSKES